MSHLLLSLLTLTALINTIPVTAATVNYSGVFAPINGSGVSGTVSVSLTDNILSVQLVASGLEPSTVHPMHIHGLLDAMGNPIPPLSPVDLDKDGFIEMPEAAQFIGNVLLALDSPQNSGAYPTASAAGTINFSQTYTVSSALLGLLTPLDLRTVEIHGLTVGSEGLGTPNEVDGAPGYKTDLPVASARLTALPEPPGVTLILAGLALIWTKRISTRK